MVRKIALVFGLVGFILGSNPASAAEDPAIQSERALVAAGIFKKVCFMMSPKQSRDERIKFLDSKFQRLEGEKKENFLKFSISKTGDVWAAVFPKGSFAVIVEPNGNCHVIAQKADDKIIHDAIKKLADEARANLSATDVNYHAIENGGDLDTSGFDVTLKQDSRVLTSVVASTATKPPENKPAAILTTVVSD